VPPLLNLVGLVLGGGIPQRFSSRSASDHCICN
jgi:hypothetical protein